MGKYDARTNRAKNTEKLELRLPPETKELVRKAADLSGREVSDWIRGVIGRAAKRVITKAAA